MNNNKQSSIELFAIALYEKGFLQGNGDEIQNLLEQAKEMEKNQHANTWDDSRVEDKGDNYVGKQKSFDNYYNETQGGNK